MPSRLGTSSCGLPELFSVAVCNLDDIQRSRARLGSLTHKCREAVISGTDGEPQDGQAGKTTHGYRCFLLDDSGRVVAREELAASEDDMAVEEARGVLEKSAHNRAELWQLARYIELLSKQHGV